MGKISSTFAVIKKNQPGLLFKIYIPFFITNVLSLFSTHCKHKFAVRTFIQS